MRVVNWKAEEVFKGIREQAIENANIVMDEVVTAAIMACPIGTITREGSYGGGTWVDFTPKRGKNKGQRVQFFTDKRWQGRKPGDLMRTIRRVNRYDRNSGNIRVYAGSRKIYWAFMVERGTVKTKAQPFLRPAFNKVRSKVLDVIKHGK